MSGKKPPSKNDSDIESIKEAFQQLSDEVKNLGKILGIEQESTPPKMTNEQPINAENDNKNKYQKDMTAEEKKAQRAAKAAEKKAKAQAAAAKKNPGVNLNTSNKSEKEKTIPQKKEVEVNGLAAEVSAISINGGKNNANISKKEVKSVLKPANKGQPSVAANREVQFDLQANTTTMVSDSEETICSTVIDPPVAPMEDALSVSHIHPAFLNLYSRCDKEIIGDLDQLCQEFITAFKEFLAGWGADRIRKNGDPNTLGHDLDQEIRPQLTYLTQCGRWPLPYALGNIVRQLKREVLKMDGNVEWMNSSNDLNQEQIDALQYWLDESYRANFETAYDAISLYLRPKIKNSKCVMTFDWCPVVNHVLLSSMKTYPDLRVCFVDPELNGKGVRHVNSFVENGYRCQYTDLKSIGFAIKQCSMVVLGCSAILSNGCVATTKGSIQLALTAKAFNVPVLVVSQYFKFVDKVQFYPRMALLGRENVELLPSNLVTAVVTDIRILPPTAAPAVLKAKLLES